MPLVLLGSQVVKMVCSVCAKSEVRFPSTAYSFHCPTLNIKWNYFPFMYEVNNEQARSSIYKFVMSGMNLQTKNINVTALSWPSSAWLSE